VAKPRERLKTKKGRKREGDGAAVALTLLALEFDR